MPRKNPSSESSDATEFFYAITPDRVLEAVESLGVRCTGRIMQLNSMENRVYEAEIDLPPNAEIKSPSERFRIVKFYRPGRWSPEQIGEEHTFLRDLVGNDIPVIAPLRNSRDQTLQRDAASGIWFALFNKMGGRSPDEFSNEQLERVGRLLARLHLCGKQRSAPTRIKLTPQTYGTQNLDYLERSKVLPPEIVGAYRGTVEQILSISREWFLEATYQRIHGDCHLGNVILGREGIFLVDFDDMVNGPCVQDFWLLLPGRDQEAKRQLSVLLTAYETLKNFDRRELRLIEPLRALRLVHYAAWVARRWTDPIFPRSFPHFGSPQYWREQLADLQEILAFVQSEPYYYAQ